MLPVVAVQIAPADPAPILEQRLLRACSVGLERARCVSARTPEVEPRAIAMVSWVDPAHVLIEVGLPNTDEPVWLSRELDFAAGDPEEERWRAAGFTIALLVDDPRFWSQSPAREHTPSSVSSPRDEATQAPLESGGPVLTEVRAFTGSGVVDGPWRWGAELRFSFPLFSRFFATSSVNYALAQDASVDLRWFDVSAGVGLYAASLTAEIDGRLRLELLAENVAATVRYEGLADRQSAWVPGVALGGDILLPIGGRWLLSARADVFWLDGSTVIVSAGRPLDPIAGAGVLSGVGLGCRF